jgi:hypothetical protein
LHDALAATNRTNTVIAWLDSASASVLRGLDAGEQLTHTALDDLPDGKPVEHLRSVLVAIGSLPPRDEHMARLERWTTHIIAARPDTEERKLLHRYALWHVVRRLRGRLAGADTTRGQSAAARSNIRAAVVLLDWLAEHDLTLTTARQGDLDAWLASPQATHRDAAGNFVRWARRNKLTQLDFAAVKWGGPTGIIDTETRWEQARRLLHDDTVKPEDRVAGLLVLLYAQPASRIVRLTLDDVGTSDAEVRLRLGREPVLLPEPLAGLVLKVAATRKGHATIGDPGASTWLFPGGRPGRALSAFRMAERLNQLGIHCGQSRSAALFQLATDLPRSRARQNGRHPHRRRGRLATSQQRRLGCLRRRDQPPDTPLKRGIQTVAISDVARGLAIPRCSTRGRGEDRHIPVRGAVRPRPPVSDPAPLSACGGQCRTVPAWPAADSKN